MKVVAVDTETHLIKPGMMAPRLVCLSYAERVDDRVVNGEVDNRLVDRREALRLLREWLADPQVALAIHNAPFDLGVACEEEAGRAVDPERPWLLAGSAADSTMMTLVFDAYRSGRVRCTSTRQKLIDVAYGMRKWRRVHGRVEKATYGLDDLVALYYGEVVDKGDSTPRLRYGLLDKVRPEDWSEAERAYALRDAVEHLRVYEAQEVEARDFPGGEIVDQAAQCRAAWALHLMASWGLRADPGAVEVFVGHCQEAIDKMQRALAGSGILKPDGSRTMSEIRRRVVESLGRLGRAVPTTEPTARFPDGQVRTDEDTLRLTDDGQLHALADALTFQKHLGQWGPVVRAATERPVCCRYNELVDNGRTSCSGAEGQEGTNIQNPPRKGDVRPCFVPRDGWVFSFTDADTVEMRANAQNALEIVGRSDMADALWDQHRNGGPDLHVRLAANVGDVSFAEAHALHKSGDEAFKNLRQLSKHKNFAFLGGAGAEMSVVMCHGFGVRLSAPLSGPQDADDAEPVFSGGKTVWVSHELEVARAAEIRGIWFETWREQRPLFAHVARLLDEGGGTAAQLMSGRIRGGCTFSSLANSLFSGRVADAEKEILFNLADECYTGRCVDAHRHGGSALCTHAGRSILYGSRPVMFLHDEPGLEHPEDGTESDRAERQRQVNVAGLSRWMPGVPCTSSAVMCRRWQKGAEPLFVGGKLVPVKPEKVRGEDGKERVKWVYDRRAA